MFEPLMVVVVVVLSIWSLILVWGTWQIRRMMGELDDERREIRRWVRLRAIYRNQSDKWQ